jgi:hypothetical protein
MNTREINGSAWSLKFFFIAAVPFSIITIVLPIIILPIFYFFARHWSASRTLIHLILILFFFIFNIIVDSLSWCDVEIAIPKLVLSFLTWIYAFSSITQFCHSVISTIRGGGDFWELLVKEFWWIVFFFFALGTNLVSFLVYPFVEIPAFLIYFAYVGIRHWRRSNKEKQ